jgi:hypothetical protein
MLDSVRRDVFFLFFEPSGLPRPRGLRAVVVSPPDAGIRVFCRPDQCSLTNSYVDNNSSLISE